MFKKELDNAVEICRKQTKEALQTVYDSLNQGQQKQIVKDEKVKTLFDLYEVQYER